MSSTSSSARRFAVRGPVAAIALAGALGTAHAGPPAAPTVAAAPAAPVVPKTDPRAVIAKKLEVRLEDVHSSPIAGLYEVVSGSDVLYVSPDGRYVVQGDMYDVDRSENITEQRLTQMRSGALAELKAVSDDQVIAFGPKDARYTVTVFTDVDCAYCRKLHSQIGEYNKLGIRIRYVFFPRSGPNTASWSKAEAVWCSANRQEALTRAKLGETVPGAAKCATPVARTYKLAHDLMLRGTPGIFTDKNEYIAGYLAPAALLERLKGHAEKPGAEPAAQADRANGASD